MENITYYLLLDFAKRQGPGPKGLSKELIKLIIEMKQRNSRFGCPGIAMHIHNAFGIDINKDVIRRVLKKCYRSVPHHQGLSWLSFIGNMKDSLWSIDLFRCQSIWNASDLEYKLNLYKSYFNQHRSHQSLQAATPSPQQINRNVKPSPLPLNTYRWQSQSNGLLQLPIAA